MSLYDIAEEYKQAFDALSEMDLDDSVFEDTLSGISAEFEAKALNVAAFIGNLEAEANAIKEAEKRMADRRKSMESKADRLKKYLKENMEKVDSKSISGVYFKLSIKNNPPSVVIDGECPDDYATIKEAKTPDKKKIKEAIDSGEDIGFAHIEKSTRLEIK